MIFTYKILEHIINGKNDFFDKKKFFFVKNMKMKLSMVNPLFFEVDFLWVFENQIHKIWISEILWKSLKILHFFTHFHFPTYGVFDRNFMYLKKKKTQILIFLNIGKMIEI